MRSPNMALFSVLLLSAGCAQTIDLPTLDHSPGPLMLHLRNMERTLYSFKRGLARCRAPCTCTLWFRQYRRFVSLSLAQLATLRKRKIELFNPLITDLILQMKRRPHNIYGHHFEQKKR